ncbi:hypothetical protein MXD63_41420, partial [Frankia sp. Cpl3]|nr:hypothetical protein [Frankia sp. Cpl3]
YLMPACLTVKGGNPSALFGRIEIEQHARFQIAFAPAKRNWPGLHLLQANQGLARRLSRLMGLDRSKTATILSRLRWNLSIEEILLAKLLPVICLLVSGGFTLYQMRVGKSVAILELAPTLFA